MRLGRTLRPNLGANQRGRASLSSSAGNGGLEDDSHTAYAIEALLDRSTTGRATKPWGIEPVIETFSAGAARPAGRWLAGRAADRLKRIPTGSDRAR